jgi:hypothetical protein
VVASPLLFLALDVEDDFLSPFLCVALSTASLYGNFIWDGVALTTGIMLVSVLQLVAFFCFFFGGPLRIMEVCQLNKLINLDVCWYFLISMLSYEFLATMPEMNKW